MSSHRLAQDLASHRPAALRSRILQAIAAGALIAAVSPAAWADNAPANSEAPAAKPVDAAKAAEAAKPADAGSAAQVKQDESYSLGLSFATQWRDGGLGDAVAEDALVRGIHAGLAGKPLTPEDRQRASTLLQGAFENWAAKNKAAAADFLARNAKAPGVKTTASGLQYLVLTAGEPKGPTVGPNDHVTVQYRGTLLNGTEFDSSYSRGKPAVIRANTVIAGWREALSMMSKGAKWKIFVPPDLAYALSPPPSIPPNSLLIFEIEILGIEAAS